MERAFHERMESGAEIQGSSSQTLAQFFGTVHEIRGRKVVIGIPVRRTAFGHSFLGRDEARCKRRPLPLAVMGRTKSRLAD